MSRRAIRKAFPEPTVDQDLDQQSSDSDLNESNAINQFSALDAFGGDSDTNSSRSPSPVPVRPMSPAKKIKKKQKQKTKKMKSLDDFDESIPLQIPSLQENLQSLSISSVPTINSLLRCEARFFDADRELRNLFGASALRQDEPDSQVERMRRPARSQRVRLRKTTIIKAKDEWSHFPLSQIGLSMRFDPQLQMFQFEMSPDYLKMQEHFEAASMTFDPQSLMALLQFQPWHCDTLIQMGEIYRVHGEFALSSDFIARALYVFECNFHSKFDVLSGDPCCYLNPQSPSTLSFTRALRRHMQLNGRKGGVRTAFEISKVLFNVSRSPTPSLPTSLIIESLMHMVYYAFKSNAFTFILDFASHFDLSLIQNTKSIDEIPLSSTLLMLPIWSFLIALAKFKTESEHGVFNDVVLVTKAVNGEDVTSSLLIQQCILLHPEALEPLLSKTCPNELSKPKWKAISKFKDARFRSQNTPSMQKLVDIFVARCHSLWKEDEILDWLVVNLQNLVQKMDEGICVSDEYDQGRVDFSQTVASEESRKIDASEFSDSVSTIPLPDQGPVNAQQMQGQPAENPFTGQNPFVAFLSSLLPWVDAPAVEQ